MRLVPVVIRYRTCIVQHKHSLLRRERKRFPWDTASRSFHFAGFSLTVTCVGIHRTIASAVLCFSVVFTRVCTLPVCSAMSIIVEKRDFKLPEGSIILLQVSCREYLISMRKSSAIRYLNAPVATFLWFHRIS